MIDSPQVLTALFLSLLIALPASAGPSTEAAAVQAPRTVSTATAATAPRAAGKPADGDSRTIDMLLQVQQPTAGLQFNERKASADSNDGRARPVPVAAPVVSPQNDLRPTRTEPLPPTPASGLFGSGATPQAQNTREMPTTTVSSEAAPTRRPSTGPSNSELARLLLLPREVIEYLRDNRGFVLGCVSGLLLLGWSGSLLFSRRRG